MKKLMIAAAIVCAAAFAQAAKVDWSATKIADPWATEAAGGTMKPAKGWAAYMIMAADYATVTADLAKGDTASLLSSYVGPAKTTSNGAVNAGTATGNVAGGNQDFYMIVLNNGTAADATYFYASTMVTTTVDASLDTLVKFGDQSGRTPNLSNWTAMAVPEPTSGLLLLLRVAGLALRRRRA